MGFYKWLGGLLGWLIGGPVVGLIGFVIGALIDRGRSTIRFTYRTGGSGQYSQRPPQRPAQDNTANAYAVLGIDATSTDDEVKSAYRHLAMQNHPDKVASLGPEAQKAAEAKFRKIQSAYEIIKKQRGLK